MDGTPASHPLQGWIPWKMWDTEPAMVWLPLDDEPFHEPFFDESLGRLKRAHPWRRMSRTAPDLLDADLGGLESLEPALLVFHVSRCGSTLLAQMLGSDPANVVLSEPPLLDVLLRQGQDARVLPLLRLLGQKRFPEQRRLVLKLDSWHLAFHNRLRALFPKVPFVFLYRDPAQVMASQRRQRGMHAVPGVIEASVFGFEADSLPQPEPGLDGVTFMDRYLEQVLIRYFHWLEAIPKADPHSLLVNFEEGPQACYERLLAFADLTPSPESHAQALARTAFHGKRPFEFHEAPPPPEPVAAELHQAYERVEALRRTSPEGAPHDR